MLTMKSFHLLFTSTIAVYFAVLPGHVWLFVTDTEDFYVKHFGNSAAEFRPWDKIRQWFAQGRIDDLKRYCVEIHKRAGNGTIVVKEVRLENRTLSFTQAEYEPRKVDVLSYSIDDSVQDRTYEYYVYPTKGDPPLLTQGWCPECVYYLVRLTQNDTEEFRIDRPVCGIFL